MEASPSAGAQESEHVVSHYEPWGVMPTNKLSATSPSVADSESYTGPKGSLTKINWQKIEVGDRKTWRCTCPGKAAFHPRRECDHIKEVKQAVGE